MKVFLLYVRNFPGHPCGQRDPNSEKRKLVHGRDHASTTQPQPQLDKAGPSQGTRSEYASLDANSAAMLNVNSISSLDNRILFGDFLYANYNDILLKQDVTTFCMDDIPRYVAHYK